jgi:phosphatidylglycerophosphate synthase
VIEEDAAAPRPALVIVATKAEAAGARMRVAGLRVIDRAFKQAALTPEARVVVVSDGSIALPPLPPNTELRRTVEANGGHPDAMMEESAAARPAAAGPWVVGADVVRLDRRRPDGIRVVDEPTRRAAEDAVFAALFRPDLGYVARWVNKPLSVRFTRSLLVHLPVTPNQITLAAAALGALGCVLISTGLYGAMVAGFALEQLQSMLDGCDGELARVRFQQSKRGAWLDTFVDDVLNVLLTAAIGIGLCRAGAGAWAAVTGLVSAAMLIVSNVVIMRDMRRQRASGDLMDMVWWFSGGRRLADLPSSGGGRVRPGIGTVLFQIGRRDTALLLWLAFAAVGLPVLVLVMASIIALAWFVASAVQLIVRPAALDTVR